MFAPKEKERLMDAVSFTSIHMCATGSVLCDLEHAMCSHWSFVWNMQLIEFLFAGSWHVCKRVHASVPVTAITVCRATCWFAYFCVFHNQTWLFTHNAHLPLFFSLLQTARDALSIFAAKCEQSVVFSESSIFGVFVDVYPPKKKKGLLIQYHSGQFTCVLLGLCCVIWSIQCVVIDVLFGTSTWLSFCLPEADMFVCECTPACQSQLALFVDQPIYMLAHICMFFNQRWLLRHNGHLLLWCRVFVTPWVSSLLSATFSSVFLSRRALDALLMFAPKKKQGLLTQYDSGQFRFVLLEAVPCDLEHSLCSYRSFVWNIAFEVLLGTWTWLKLYAWSWHACMRVQASVPVTAITVCRSIGFFAHLCVL